MSKNRKHLRIDQLVLTVLPDSSAECIAVRAPLMFLTDSISIIFSHLKHFNQSQKYLDHHTPHTPTEFKQKWRLGVLNVVACLVCIWAVTSPYWHSTQGGQSTVMCNVRTQLLSHSYDKYKSLTGIEIWYPIIQHDIHCLFQNFQILRSSLVLHNFLWILNNIM